MHAARNQLSHAFESCTRFVVVVEHAPVGQGDVGDKVMRADDLADREIRDRSIHMRDEVQSSRSEPRASHRDVRKIIGNELADFRMPLDAGNQFLS